jgi:hypothetical protein
MKRIIASMTIVAACFLSCTSTKQNVQERMTVDEYYKDNPYAKDYLKEPFRQYLITEGQARIYANAFRNHKYRVWRNKRNLDTAWSSFDTLLLKTVIADRNTDSVVFLLAAFPRWDRTVPQKRKRHPFIILQGIPKSPTTETARGGFFPYDVALSRPIYFVPKYICPPPNTGCSIPAPK